jgi:hypothetical protein
MTEKNLMAREIMFLKQQIAQMQEMQARLIDSIAAVASIVAANGVDEDVIESAIKDLEGHP